MLDKRKEKHNNKETSISAEKFQVVKELHTQARRNFSRRRVIVRGLNETWQSDLLQIDQHARENKGYKYILVVIDIFSKYLWTESLKDKSGNSVTSAFESILKRVDQTPKNLQTDNGKEYYNTCFNNLMKQYSINHYSTYSTKKAQIAERVIRSLKELLYKSFSLRGTYRWYDILSKITNEYNHRKHRTIGMRPVDVNKNNEQKLLNTVYSHMKIAGQPKYRIGQVVRISKEKAVFEKGYTPNWSTELFKIRKIKMSMPVVYELEDMYGEEIKGYFYTEELLPAKYEDVYLIEKIIKRKGNKIYVKWLGFDAKHNSWINESNKL